MKTEFSLSGSQDLLKALQQKGTMTRFENAIKHHTANLDNQAKRNAVFRGHFKGKKFIRPTGDTRRTIKLRIEDQGKTGVVFVEAEHAPYLEFGTRYMDAQPFLGPAFRAESKALKDTLIKALKKR